MSNHINLVRIKAVSRALQDLRDQVVFVGGATVSLYADRPVLEIRPTDDVDVIVEILNYSQREHLEEHLRTIGFSNDVESGIVCRYKIQGIIVDIMPTEDPSIGFTNKWYPEGFKHAQIHELNDGTNIKILTAPYFIATKLEAYKGRGMGDGRLSHDFEDIVFVLENRESMWNELATCHGSLKDYLVSEFTVLMDNPDIHEWIGSHVERNVALPATSMIIKNLKDWLKKVIES